MIEWEMTSRGLRVTDADNAEVVICGEDVTVDDTESDVSRPVDETICVTARSLEFPHAVVYAFALESDERYELDPQGEPLSLPAREYVVDVDTEIKSYLRFTSTATIERTADFESIVVSFPELTRVVLGFRSRHELPAESITVPDSPIALARAVTYLAASHKTSSPDRTYPTLRGHPPLLESGDRLDVPECVQARNPESGIELFVPPNYESVYVVAPLAYFLQATIRPIEASTDRTFRPQLRVPAFGVDEPLPRMPDLEEAVTRLLRKTFFLECLVRNAGPYGTSLSESWLLEEVGLNAETLYEASPQRRLARYLDVPFSAIHSHLPEWHLSTYVTPSYDRLEALPFLLDRLSLIYTPRTSELAGRELVERSLDEFYRGRAETTTSPRDEVRPGEEPSAQCRASDGQVASVDVVKPHLRHGRVHGWLADGVPIDVFKATTAAYENRLAYLERNSDQTSIRVVLNDPDMAGERATVAEIYRQRSDELPMDVTVEESLRTAELARIFESNHDFVHYIGHCETDGLRCSDGYLSTSSIDRCRVQTFFLNACGSFYEGASLIERGSVAGAVTITQVLNDHAVRVGSTFAKLLVHGFSIERAMQLARRRIMMGKDYAVVGDGTHSLTQGEHRVPTTLTIEALKNTTSRDEHYQVTFDCYSARITGSYYFPHTENNDRAYLCGQQSQFELSRSELATVLKETEASVIYNGDLYWSEDLGEAFSC
ncbi:hypothetical protein [Natrarchaeobaculum sulfurireducens]|uniref:CHAT domain-containing protein n=1 Tax=Natrarchaeobaculum sulfurireducens TaxID=2044521 RepID=A0A346PQ85_9EURY|nr:hypothetical protein [Natrarchaeobaculum sulfurireducens]AXR81680.1 hypothetical protein AArcMg_1670 [Natrarchaeobaculum sulfurireducens]